MLAFQPIEADNVSEFSRYFQCQKFRTCDYTLAGIFMWRKFFYSEYAVNRDKLFFKVRYVNGKTAFTLPTGCGSTEDALETLEHYARRNKMHLAFCAVPEEGLAILKNRYGDAVAYTQNRDSFDYLYIAEDMRSFAGRRFSGQRNHVNKFQKLYPDFRYVTMNKDNIGRVIEFFDRYAPEHVKDNPIAREETLRAKEILTHFVRFGLLGGFLEVDGQIIAFSIGEIVGDTLFVHIEKALKEYQGSYQMMVKQFALHEVTENVRYINREDDAGDPGLRKSKLSYHPVRLLEKYFVTVEDSAWQ
ncbi:DUF2156 domain-containing protein [Caproiciproducens galactitolivorans]|uniref:Phosphatidylglycerol lysyltransferase C-terminal domain-containing protein n=1 Tax=Caproiciproducens galactitolivorans TaxID=642589 RepID=A0A4Z0XWW7_9FIRM|nr:phosphatidylglycerol lysyltransferase domain-containing protein [Caproiciproducens galactitolivorans]QEY34772.1 DUF2156 domain-containing protein [Caproiciproducens galactitolivorans]TGJ75979.1 hypothetical protein CAGA_19550 [Caproiciproducens galactitolivorans]